ncbi:hypothetical protein LOZ58_001676 [Ophidiomyces ophidiicola]|nr:hypothetical protein LOZ66_001198 [Ophidiomyces ophidiicola]KAI1964983.1 hypothetical protein LOZ58_001676 [Ophidiomyces ophidiicola]
MKFSAILAVTAAGLVSAQIPQVPGCSINCFLTALTGGGCSGLTDWACQCKRPDLPPKIIPCVQKACPQASDQSAVSSIVVSVCSKAGVPISIPPV